MASKLEEGVSIEKMLPCPIEEMPDVGVFDLVVMINVIEHCYDVQAIFRNVLRLCRPGAIFVFHDRLYNADDVVKDTNTRFDAGHPLRVNGPIILRFLDENFIPLLNKQVDVADSAGDIDLTERGVYYIGKRR